MDKTICFYCGLPASVCDCKLLEAFEREQERRKDRQYPLVQIKPDVELFGGCFLTVTETKSWGVMGYIQSAGVKGQQWLRVPNEDFVDTGGEAIWAITDGDDGDNAA